MEEAPVQSLKEHYEQECAAIAKTIAWIRDLIEKKLSHFSNGKHEPWRSWDLFCPIRDEYEYEVLHKLAQDLRAFENLVISNDAIVMLQQRFMRILQILKPPQDSSAIGHIYMLLNYHRTLALLRIRN